VRRQCAKDVRRLRIGIDPKGVGAARWNALWRPRVYVVGPDGRVAYVQPDTAIDIDTPREVQAVLDRGAR